MSPLMSSEVKKFQQKILDWYEKNKRDLPWRRTRDPYKIWISEIMLQQTQVSRVIPKYEAWLEKFPTVASLAKAKTADVLAMWSGLGYNRRALNLKKTAERVVNEFGGKFPRDEKLLRSLPGIGEYTAGALLCFAFDEQIAVVDTNIRKVILTQFLNLPRHSGNGGRSPSSSASEARQGWGSDSRISQDKPVSAESDSGQARMTEREIQNIAEQLLPKGKAYEWNQALMDYSSAMLREHKIPIPKQSKFQGSHRYYRGQVLKQLLEKKEIPLTELGKLIKNDFKSSEQTWLHNLILELKKEGFITVRKKDIILA